MKIVSLSITALLYASILGSPVICLSGEIPATGNYAQKALQDEAIILRIEQNNVTLQTTGDKGKKVTAPFSNATEFKVGDKVVVVGNTLKRPDQVEAVQPGGAYSDTNTAPATKP